MEQTKRNIINIDNIFPERKESQYNREIWDMEPNEERYFLYGDDDILVKFITNGEGDLQIKKWINKKWIDGYDIVNPILEGAFISEISEEDALRLAK
jgi:hypothetical protein